MNNSSICSSTCKRFFSLLFFCVFLTANLFAQVWYYTHTPAGPGNNEGKDVVLDQFGYSYETGTFRDSIWYAKGTLYADGGSDIHLQKHDSLAKVVWSTKFGGDAVSNSVEVGEALEIDLEGNLFLTGEISSDTAWFDSIPVLSAGGSDAFLARIDTAGKVLWAKSYGGNGDEYSLGLRIDGGAIFTTGHFQGAASFDSISVTSAGGFDVFIARFDSNGVCSWVQTLQSPEDEFGLAVTTDEFGNIYATGHFIDSINCGGTTLYSDSGGVFIVKLDPNGNVVWARGGIHSNGNGVAEGHGISSDQIGGVYVTGRFSDSLHWDQVSLVAAGTSDMFLAKYDYNGNIINVVQGGGVLNNCGRDVEADDDGNVFVTGYYGGSSATFSPLSISIGPSNENMFVMKYDGCGEAKWIRAAGDNGDDTGNGISAVNGNTVTTGTYVGPMQFNVAWHPGTGSTDIFTVRIVDTVSVSSIHPTAAFSFASSNLSVNFFDSSLNTSKWLWDFGDGNSDTAKSPTHIYSGNGNYVVCLKAYNDCGLDSVCDTVSLIVNGRNSEMRNASVYPNPFEDLIIIYLGAASTGIADLIDLTGKRINRYRFDGKKELRLEVNDLRNGLYLLDLQITGEKRSVFKLIHRE